MREGAKRTCPTMAEEYMQYEYEPFAWRLTREQIGRDLRERYSVAQELPPHLLALLKKLDAVEDNQLSEELSPHSRTLS